MPLLLFAGTVLHAPTSAAEDREMVFARADDLASLSAQRFYSAYTFATGRRFFADGRQQSVSLKHRFLLSYGIADALLIGAEQVVKHHAAEPAKPGVFRPELRLDLGALLPESVGAWPQGLSVFFAPRVRFNGRRASTLNFGLGTRTQRLRRPAAPGEERSWVVTLNTELEITAPEPDRESEIGLRYDAGFGYQLLDQLLAALETWGHASWDSEGFVEQEHAFGPTLTWFVGPTRLGINGSVWLRDIPGAPIRTDVRGTFLVALRL